MRGHSASGSSCMPLDLPTIFAATVVANAIAGMLLFLSWTQYRNIPSLAAWSVAFLLGAIATTLVGLRGQIHDFYSIALANMLFAASWGISWGGVRAFVGRPVPLLVVFAGAALWIAACQVEAFYQSLNARMALLALIVVSYVLMSAWEFDRASMRRSRAGRSSCCSSSMRVRFSYACPWRPRGLRGRRQHSYASNGWERL